MPETPDEMKALIAEARTEQSIHAKLAKGYAVGSEQRRWHEEHQDRYGRFADALEALSAHPAEETEWGFESPQTGLWYVTRNAMLAETMQAARPEAVLHTRKAGPWSPVPTDGEGD